MAPSIPGQIQLYSPGQRVVGELAERRIPVGFEAKQTGTEAQYFRPPADRFGDETILSADKFAALQKTEAEQASSPYADFIQFSPTAEKYQRRDLPVYMIEEIPRPEAPQPEPEPNVATSPSTPDAGTTTPSPQPQPQPQPAPAPPQRVAETAVTPQDTPTFGQRSPLLRAQVAQNAVRQQRRRRPTREVNAFLGSGQTLGAG